MTTVSETPPVRPTPIAGRREWLGLAVLALPILVISVDFSVLNLALPQLTRDLAPTSTEQLWILAIYGFMIAGFLVTMGALGDRLGRRRLMLSGAAAFGAASVLAAFSTSAAMLITARALMGVAAATLAPSGLALINHMFRDPRQRAAAVAVFMSSFMGGGVVGPVIGGVMLANFWWGSVFLLAVPVVALLLATGPLLLPEYRAPGAGRPDPVSVVLSLAAILPVVYGVTELAHNGRAYWAWAVIAAGAVVGALFVVRQLRLTNPLLDLRLFANRAFRGAVTLGFAGGAVQGGSLLMINLYLQMVRGYSPLRAGLWMVPPALAMFLTIGMGLALARAIRPAHIIAVGMAVSSIGYLVITRVSANGGLALLVVGFAIAMAGIGPGLSLGYDMVLGAAPPEQAGAAAATVETGGQLGVATGIAVLGSIGAAVYRGQVVVPAGLPPQVANAAHDSVAAAAAVARHMPDKAAAASLLDSARAAFTSGLHSVSLIGAVLFLGLAILAIVTLRQVLPIGASAPRSAAKPDAEPEAADPQVTTAITA